MRGAKRRLWLLWWAIESLLTSVLSLALFVLLIVSVPLIAVWVGVPMLILVGYATRLLANRRRWALQRFGYRNAAPPYLRGTVHGPLRRMLALAADPATLRDACWLAVNGTLGLTLSIIALVEAIFDLLIWILPPGLVARLHAGLDEALLAVSKRSQLALRVQQLTESRAETVDTQAAELRRIERDLHDGAQARLVALGMNLALAEARLDRDPAGARELLAEARDSSIAALAELRDLVRGIHPPVLADRGLVGAVQALALASPLPVRVQATVPQRLPAPVESAAYFALAEGITNAIRHSGAEVVEVQLRTEDDLLYLDVRDNGRGGADPANGSGLTGIQRRLSAFDGTVRVISAAQQGTVLAMVLPCASSSPKILPSSATG